MNATLNVQFRKYFAH